MCSCSAVSSLRSNDDTCSAPLTGASVPEAGTRSSQSTAGSPVDVQHTDKLDLSSGRPACPMSCLLDTPDGLAVVEATLLDHVPFLIRVDRDVSVNAEVV